MGPMYLWIHTQKWVILLFLSAPYSPYFPHLNDYFTLAKSDPSRCLIICYEDMQENPKYETSCKTRLHLFCHLWLWVIMCRVMSFSQGWDREDRLVPRRSRDWGGRVLRRLSHLLRQHELQPLDQLRTLGPVGHQAEGEDEIHETRWGPTTPTCYFNLNFL